MPPIMEPPTQIQEPILPEPDKPAESYGCPHCRERVQIIHFSSPDKYDLVKWEPSNPEQAAVLQKAIDAQREKITGISARLINHTKTRDALESQHRELSSCDVTAHAEHLAAVREAERLVKECEDAQAELGKEIMQSPGKPVDEMIVGDHVRLFGGIIAPYSFKCGDYTTIHDGVWCYGRKACEIGHNGWFGMRCTLDCEGGFRVGNGFGAGEL